MRGVAMRNRMKEKCPACHCMVQDLRARSGNRPRYRSAFAGDRFIVGFISPTPLGAAGCCVFLKMERDYLGVLCAPEMLTIDALSRGRSWERRAVAHCRRGNGTN